MNQNDQMQKETTQQALQREMEELAKERAHVNETPKSEHDSDDVLDKSGNVNMMCEALRNNIRGFLCERTGMFKFVLSDAECHEDWKEMMLIPNLPNEIIDSVLAAEPAPLVRLTDEQIQPIIESCYEYCPVKDRRFFEPEKFANAIMDAMQERNK